MRPAISVFLRYALSVCAFFYSSQGSCIDCRQLSLFGELDAPAVVTAPPGLSVTQTRSLYHVEDPKAPGISFAAVLQDGDLQVSFGDGNERIRPQEQLAAALQHFGDEVQTITDTFTIIQSTYRSAPDANLAEYRAQKNKGASDVEAARATPLGRLAATQGFTEVSFYTPRRGPMRVYFRRP